MASLSPSSKARFPPRPVGASARCWSRRATRCGRVSCWPPLTTARRSPACERSQAQVAQAQAELRNAQAQFDRTRDLQSKGFVSAAALDTADSQLKSAKAGRDQASAGAKQSALAQGFTRVSAPFDGWVLQTQAEAGDLAVPGKPLVDAFTPPSHCARWCRCLCRGRRLRKPPARWRWQCLAPMAACSGFALRRAAACPRPIRCHKPLSGGLALSPEAGRALLPGQQVRVRFAVGSARAHGGAAGRRSAPGRTDRGLCRVGRPICRSRRFDWVLTKVRPGSRCLAGLTAG